MQKYRKNTIFAKKNNKMSPISEKVSGLIITYNEEKNIAEALSCFDFCDCAHC